MWNCQGVFVAATPSTQVSGEDNPAHALLVYSLVPVAHVVASHMLRLLTHCVLLLAAVKLFKPAVTPSLFVQYRVDR